MLVLGLVIFILFAGCALLIGAPENGGSFLAFDPITPLLHIGNFLIWIAIFFAVAYFTK